MTDLDFAPVIWRLGLWAGDQLVGDADDYPDTIWFDSGRILLTPYTGVGKVIGAIPVPYTGVSSTYECEIDSEGYLTYHGQRVMWVTDLTSDKVNPQIPADKATHRVIVTDATAGGETVTLQPFDVRITMAGDGISTVLVDGEPVPANDITRLAPVIPGEAQPIYRGERGISIASLVVTDLGELEVELDDGTTVNAGELPVGPGGSDPGVAGYLANPASATSTEAATAATDPDHPLGAAIAELIADIPTEGF